MLRFIKVYKSYKSSVFRLTDINLDVNAGEFVFIIGKTGAGKTTLLKMAYGEEKPEDGTVSFLGTDLSKTGDRTMQELRRKIGLVFQEGGLIEDKNVGENIAYPLYIQGIGREAVRKRVTIVLRLVGLMGKKDMYPRELSGGEKQKACIARAMVSDPRMIIADEPTGNIDREATNEVMCLLKKINEKGTTVIVATHDMGIVGRFGKRVIEINEGTIIRDISKG